MNTLILEAVLITWSVVGSAAFLFLAPDRWPGMRIGVRWILISGPVIWLMFSISLLVLSILPKKYWKEKK